MSKLSLTFISLQNGPLALRREYYQRPLHVFSRQLFMSFMFRLRGYLPLVTFLEE
jgi:hypothetical protein